MPLKWLLVLLLLVFAVAMTRLALRAHRRRLAQHTTVSVGLVPLQPGDVIYENGHTYVIRRHEETGTLTWEQLS